MQETSCQEKYRRWAERRLIALPLYWQPRWLDLVCPDWKASCEDDDWTNPKWVWPYCYKRKGFFRIMQLPDSTPYLGPLLVDERANLPELPINIDYGIFTFIQPAISWSYAKRSRAMATLVIDLNQATTYSRNINRRLSKGIGELNVVRISDNYFAQATELVNSARDQNPANILPIMIAAEKQQFGECWGVVDHGGDLQALGGLLFDERTAYFSFSVRSKNAHPSANPMLYDQVITRAKLLGKEKFDFTSGYLMGPKKFSENFGAKASWYGQARVAKGPLMKFLEIFRGMTNTKRI